MADESQTSETNPTQPVALPFDAFVGPHLAVLLRVAGSLCRNSHDAEDLVQDALIRAFNGIGSFDGAYPRAWLLTIMRIANINRHRRQRPGLLRDATDLGGEADRHNAPAPSAEDVAASHESPPWVADALARLSERHLQVVRLVDIDGLTYGEAAVALGIPAAPP
ncbi:MAG: RNA polymerase sigma factor [Ilumatobacteraceae bacterium]